MQIYRLIFLLRYKYNTHDIVFIIGNKYQQTTNRVIWVSQSKAFHKNRTERVALDKCKCDVDTNIINNLQPHCYEFVQCYLTSKYFSVIAKTLSDNQKFKNIGTCYSMTWGYRVID